MKNLESITLRIENKWFQRESFRAKARHINKSFVNHNQRFANGKEKFKVNAEYDDHSCRVSVSDHAGRFYKIEAELY